MANSQKGLISIISLSLIALGFVLVLWPSISKDDISSQEEVGTQEFSEEEAGKLDQLDNNDEIADVWEVSEPDGYINGHGYVDLGLPSGLKWAVSNIGANSPEECGDKFAWDETKPKEVNDSQETKETNKNNKAKDEYASATYNREVQWLISNDYVTENGNLTLTHDAARQILGGTWRMPTKVEMEELLSNTTLAWGSFKEEKGAFIRSNINGKTIFLAAAHSAPTFNPSEKKRMELIGVQRLICRIMSFLIICILH